ncbi:MAG: plastocyanin/azurin family copper-binding protein [Verrucomicrobiota bacterium]|nr:plastocyanin/azurin family copper-binding protein [Verrucomicrobiota bacterium]
MSILRQHHGSPVRFHGYSIPKKQLVMLLLIILAFAVATASTFAAPLKVVIGTLPGLQYDKPRFEALPGQDVMLTFRNSDEMAHNLVIVASGTRLEIVQAALTMMPDSGYIPNNSAVLWHTPVLKPDESAGLKFKAPHKKGIYPYVCTYPGHGLIMYGAMYVGIKMPVLAQDQNVPPMARVQSVNKSLHAWPHRRPLMYRIFMPDASPAAIAVALPHGISYCWDAGTCHLRYAWIGGFIDPMPVWKGNGNGLAEIIGTRFYSAPKDCPIRVDGALYTVRFKGYRKIEGHPEFHYTVSNLDIYERITALPDGMGLKRHFRMPNAKEPVLLTIKGGHAEIDYLKKANHKKISGNRVVKIPANEAREFTLIHRHILGK